MPPKAPPTHFLCIPLVTPASRSQLVQSLGSFREDVTSPTSFGIPPDAVRPLGTLHLTLGVMSFPRNEGLDKAVEVLKALKPTELLAEIRRLASVSAARASAPTTTTTAAASTASKLPAQGLSITLQGLHTMQKASTTTVLYAPPSDREGILQQFCEKLRAAFREDELMVEENRPLLLHATIVNTIYVRGGRSAAAKGGKARAARLTVDATDILGRYDDYVWMRDVPVEKIAICRMGAKKVGTGEDDVEYEVEAEIDV